MKDNDCELADKDGLPPNQILWFTQTQSHPPVRVKSYPTEFEISIYNNFRGCMLFQVRYTNSQDVESLRDLQSEFTLVKPHT